MAVPLRNGSRVSAETLGRYVAGAALLLGALAVANVAIARRAERRHPPRGHFIEADGVQLHYLEAGRGAPVVLLHGNGAMAEDFVISGVFDRLARHHRVIAFDRPGFGYSDRPRDRAWTAGEQAKLILDALDQLDVQAPILLAHSWGTMVALEMALLEPRGVAGMVLASGYYHPTPRLDVALFSPPAIPVIGDLMRYTVSPVLGWALAPVFFRKLFAPAPVTEDFEHRFPTSLALRPWQIRASAADTALMIPGAAALADRYGELDVPVAIVAAPGDRIVDTDTQAVALHRALRDSRLHLIHEAGHMVHHTAPDQVIAAVEELAAASQARSGPAHAQDEQASRWRLA